MQNELDEGGQDIAVKLRQWATATATVPIVIGAIALLGWLAGMPLLTSYFPGTKTIAPSAALILIIYGLILLNINSLQQRVRVALTAIVVIVSLLALAEMFFGLFGNGWSPEWALLQQIPALAVTNARISPVASALSVLSGLMLLLLLFDIKQRMVRHIPGWLALCGFIISVTFLLGYLYGAPLLYGSTIIPIAFPAALGFFCLSIAGIVAAGLERQPLRWLVGRSKSVRLLRVFLPFTIGAMFLEDILQAYLQATFHLNNALIAALFFIIFAVLATLLISVVSNYIGNDIDRAERELEAEKERWRMTMLSIGDAVIATDRDANVTMMNVVSEQLTGWLETEARGHHITEVFHIINETTRKVCINPISEVLRQGKIVGLANHTVLIARDGTEYSIADSGAPIIDGIGEISGVVLVFRDITQEFRINQRQTFMHQVLSLLNSPTPEGELIPTLVHMLREFTGFTAVGLRMQQGEDFPYFTTEGFSDDFLASEKSLCCYDTAGNICRDDSGQAVLECLCASVLRHHTWPELQDYFTSTGSFWVNNLPELVAKTPPADLPAHLRGVCPALGYHSVALIPLYSSGQTIGLLQLNDPRPNMITAEMVQYLEEVSTTIGIAMARRRANLVVHESEEHFRLLYEYSPVSYQSLDINGNFVDVNDSWLKLLGYQRDEVIGHWFGDFIIPEQQELFRQRFPQFIERGAVIGVEFDFVTKDGSIVSTSIDGRIAHDVNGNFQNTHCVLHDVTERKRNEELVKRERDQAKMYLDIAAVIIGTLDNQGNITMLNHRGCQILGYSEEELLGRNWFDTCIPDDKRKEVRTYFQGMIAGILPIAEVFENQIITRTGERRLVFFQNAAIMDDEGKIQRMLFSGEDITERANAEEQLRQAAKMESIGRLAGGVAHDFNNILTGIMGMTQLVQMRIPEESPLQPDMADIMKLSERAAGLTRQLLTFSRRQPIAPRLVDINELITNDLKMLQRMIGEDVALSFVPGADPSTVRVDEGQIEQLLMNLAINARDAMPRGGCLAIITENAYLDEFYVASRMGATVGEYIQITVTDTGEGMDEETQQRIFEPFFTTKDIGKGTGLGLATVYGIVKQHHGNIWVYSEKGQGTTFKIYLPYYSPEDGDTEQHHAAAMPKRGSETILLVEDEDAVRRVTQNILEKNGYTVLMASSADEAEDIFSLPGTKIDMLLTDVIMPGRSGIELYKALRGTEPNLKVLFMSGYSVFNLQETLPPSFDAMLLQKPFTRDNLLSRVRGILDADKLGAQSS
ncbi:MAG: PAS domain S-box protein [bacterium]